ncbi:RAB6-interacting golgin [Nymphalis io]|uniref:RAB6-interacting golgin n=1 Tax=Inachis io TaxID=171585 RepID=UPI002166D8C4|nr:RAB6-interacting golgin [Nymphalis io]
MSFTGFSEEDLKRMKTTESSPNSGSQANSLYIKKIDKIGSKLKRPIPQYKLPIEKLSSDDAMDTAFDKCKLSLKTPTSTIDIVNNNEVENITISKDIEENIIEDNKDDESNVSSRKSSSNVAPDVVRCVDNYTEDDLATHKIKLEELQLKQKLMEEQNKKRKEMLAKALADRTKQTEEEVVKLEKIKKELQILDGQFSQDVAVLRKKIDQACISYSDAEKHYLRVEKEFLQAKINLQKEKEKKELLTEHLCALITHNETRKAQKLETLMLELASDRNSAINKVATPVDETPVIIDGVDERSGKIVEIIPKS